MILHHLCTIFARDKSTYLQHLQHFVQVQICIGFLHLHFFKEK